MDCSGVACSAAFRAISAASWRIDFVLARQPVTFEERSYRWGAVRVVDTTLRESAALARNAVRRSDARESHREGENPMLNGEPLEIPCNTRHFRSITPRARIALSDCEKYL